MKLCVGNSYLDSRLELLRRTQNRDGGWAYFPGKQSWIEPTAYAAMALHGEPAADRAWQLLKSWQNPNGSWRAGADVQIESWATALCVTLAVARGEFDDSAKRGVNWLLGTQGTEVGWIVRAAAKIGLYKADRNYEVHGWPWKPDTASWVEPSAHALVALRLAAPRVEDRRITERLRSGYAELLDVRTRDGGWNYGNKWVWGVDLPSYPETTGIALVGLQGAGVSGLVEVAEKMLASPVSPLARAWLAIGLRLYGVEVPEPSGDPSPDLLLAAVEAIGCANYRFFKTGGET